MRTWIVRVVESCKKKVKLDQCGSVARATLVHAAAMWSHVALLVRRVTVSVSPMLTATPACAGTNTTWRRQLSKAPIAMRGLASTSRMNTYDDAWACACVHSWLLRARLPHHDTRRLPVASNRLPRRKHSSTLRVHEVVPHQHVRGRPRRRHLQRTSRPTREPHRAADANRSISFQIDGTRSRTRPHDLQRGWRTFVRACVCVCVCVCVWWWCQSGWGGVRRREACHGNTRSAS